MANLSMELFKLDFGKKRKVFFLIQFNGED